MIKIRSSKPTDLLEPLQFATDSSIKTSMGSNKGALCLIKLLLTTPALQHQPKYLPTLRREI